MGNAIRMTSVENNTGFANLVQLTSAGFLEGFSRGKANVDMELLAAHSEGVIVLTGSAANHDISRARSAGAAGYVTKDQIAGDLVRAILDAAAA